MQEIILTRNLKCFVDDDLYEVAKYNQWCAQEAHAKEEKYYVAVRAINVFGIKTRVYLHRLASGVPKCFKIKYKDGNWLNYQHDNIRYEDRNGNRYQYHKFKKDSQYKGVVFDYYYGMWRSEFHRLIIGYYINEVDAARAYNIKMREIFKNPPKSRLNEIAIMERYADNNRRLK